MYSMHTTNVQPKANSMKWNKDIKSNKELQNRNERKMRKKKFFYYVLISECYGLNSQFTHTRVILKKIIE